MSGVERNLNARNIDTNLNLDNLMRDESVYDQYVNSPALRRPPSHSPDLVKSGQPHRGTIGSYSQMSKFNAAESPDLRRSQAPL